jgi:LPS-assembly lipoprotein
MWFSRRSLLAAALAALLPGCGFTPLDASGSPARALQGTVQVPAGTDRMGFDLREELVNRLGEASAPRYLLSLDTGVERQGLAITPDGSVTRYNLTAVTDFALSPLSGGPALIDGSVTAFTAYSTASSAYATLVAERDARRRLAVSLADQIAIRLAAFAGNLPP